MYSFVEYRKEYRVQWNHFVKEHGNIFHTLEWKEVLEETFGYKTRYMMAMDDDGSLIGIVPLIICRDLKFKKIAVGLPFVNYIDVCCKDKEAFEFITDQLHPLMNYERLNYIELRLKEDFLEEHLVELNDNNYTLVLPLEGNEESVMELSSSNNRNHIRKTYKNSWFDVSLSWDNIKPFYEVYSHTMKRLGSPCPSLTFFEKVKEKLGKRVTLLTVLNKETDDVIGGMILFLWNDVLYYYWGGALEEYNKKYVNNFMYWEAVKFALSQGCKELDLGRSPKDSGTYVFKQKFGAVPYKLNYYRICKQVGKNKPVEKEDFELAIKVWKKIPKKITDGIGKRLIKYVMP